MRTTEQQLRSVTLAQAIEHADGQHTLVTLAEREAALASAWAQARARGAERPGVGDVVLGHAAAVVERASTRDATVAALQAPSTRLRWLARLAPLVALALGLWSDRVGNAHRVDLLAPALLAVLAWNLVTYGLLAVRGLQALWARRAAPPEFPTGDASERAPLDGGGHLPDAGHQGSAIARAGAWLRALHAWGHGATGRGGRRSLSSRVAAEFQLRWWGRTQALSALRAQRVLHLCAAAWAAGIALSLLLRGLVVRYQFGWESTFLDAAQVHALVGWLFWPLTAIAGLAPFTLQDIVATQNFAGEAGAGGRWVWMYVGLLTAVVVLPRLVLAAWSRWREARWAEQCMLDLNEPALAPLRQALPQDLVLVMQGLAQPQAEAWQAQVEAQWAAQRSGATTAPAAGKEGDLARRAEGESRRTDSDAAQGFFESALGDRLWFRPAGDPHRAPAAANGPVPSVAAVLVWEGAGAPVLPGPPAEAGAPRVAVRWADIGASWVLESTLFLRLEAALPVQRPALQRLQAAWAECNEARFARSLALLAVHLDRSEQAPPRPHSQPEALAALEAGLRALHAQPPAAARGEAGSGAVAQSDGDPATGPLEALVAGGGAAMALGTTAGAAAGAAAGAKLGALVDVGTGGLTLGAGTALGATLGGATAWVLGKVRRQEPLWAEHDEAVHAEGLLQVQEACLLYLRVAHAGRLSAPQAAAAQRLWRDELALAVRQQAERLHALRHGAAPQLPEVQALLDTLVRGVLRRGVAPGRSGQGGLQPASTAVDRPRSGERSADAKLDAK